MFDKLLIEFRDDHIHIHHGNDLEITPDGMEHFWQFLAEKCRQYDCTSILVEAESPKRQMDTVEAFTSGVEASGVASNLWLALCFHNYEPDEISELFKQVAA